MKIRHSEPGDIARIMEIYEYARGFMAAHGNPNQWGANKWPPEELIREDIDRGFSYVCTSDDGKVIGTFFLWYGPDIEATYAGIEDGEWLDESPYGVIHRLAGDGSEKGIGEFCINWAYDECKHLRVDTHGDNLVLQRLLAKLGFVRCGTIHVVQDNYPRIAYEKSEKTLALGKG